MKLESVVIEEVEVSKEEKILKDVMKRLDHLESSVRSVSSQIATKGQHYDMYTM